MLLKKACALPALILLFSSGVVGATTITVGTSTSFGTTRNFLRYIDTATALLTLGPEVTGIPNQLTDIAYDPSGALYGINGANLFLIDENTGVATDIGRTLRFTEFMNALAFDASGTLYAASGNSSNLLTLDPATGVATLAGSLPNGLPSAGDLAFDDAGVLWATTAVFTQSDRLARLTPGGVGTDIGPLGRNSVFGLAFAEGRLYGIGGGLYEIDRSSGAVISDVGGYSFVQGAAVNPIPEPSTACLLLGGLALLSARHRRLARVARPRYVF